MLQTNCELPRGADVFVIGHGAIKNKGTLFPRLLYAILKTTSEDVCRHQYPLLLWRKSVMCAVHKGDFQSACNGDSGGPLITVSTGQLVGITSFVDKGWFLLLISGTNISNGDRDVKCNSKNLK